MVTREIEDPLDSGRFMAASFESLHLPLGAVRVNVAWAAGRLPEPVSVWRSGGSGETLTFVFRGIQFSVYNSPGVRVDLEEAIEGLFAIASNLRPPETESPLPGSETD